MGMLNHRPFPYPEVPVEVADDAMSRIGLATVVGIPAPSHADSSRTLGPCLGVLPAERWAFKASGRWHIKARCRCRKASWRSMEEVWHRPPDTLKGMIESGADDTKLYAALRRFGYAASQFNPYTAAYIYSTLCPPGGKVLDPCAGWGDRLAAALSCHQVASYHGFDANGWLQEGYTAQVNRYGNTDYTVQHAAFEDVHLTNKYDVAFTSPPYGWEEIYSTHEEQSTYRYQDIEEWFNRFLYPLIYKCSDALNDGGYLTLNLPKGALMYRALDVSPLEYLGHWIYLIGREKTEPVLLWRKHGG